MEIEIEIDKDMHVDLDAKYIRSDAPRCHGYEVRKICIWI